jgi:serine protease Do
MTFRTVPIALILLLSSLTHAEIITLKGGETIQAPLVRESDDAIVLDLGFDLLRIPREKILSIDADQDTPTDSNASSSLLYQAIYADRLTTAEASKKYAPAVVLVKTAAGLGSGFFVNKEGYLITNYHVIAGEKRIAVTQFIKEGTALRKVIHKEVEIIAVAPFHDLAVLKLKNFDTEITPVNFAPTEDLHVGETVFAIGNPLGLERSVTEGVISQTHRNFGGILYLQIDAPVNPGNSGGPLFNTRGQVIGIINMGIPTMEGLNFSIPAGHAKYIMDHLEAFAYDASNSESGYVYPDPPRRPGIFISQTENTNEK